MSNDPHRWDGLGMPDGYLKPGMAVMVAVGTIPAQVNGHPPIIAYATVIGRADQQATAALVNRDNVWWLDVHMGASEPLPQMYRADQILGIPAMGLRPTDAIVVRE